MKIRLLLGVCISLVRVALSSQAIVPEELHGTWIVDAKTTLIAMRRSPKWKEEDEKMAEMGLKYMQTMWMKFTEDSMVQGQKSESMAIKPTMVSSGKGRYVFTGDVRGKTVTFTALIGSNGLLNLRVKDHDDMDYIIWKKGTPSESGPSAAGMMTEVMTEAIKSGMSEKLSSRPSSVPTTSSPSSEAYTLKFGRLNIFRLTDNDVSEINAIAPERRTKVQIEKECTQADFNNISKITGISDLTIGRKSPITSLAPLSMMKDLRKLKLTSLQHSKESPIDLGQISGLTNLEELNCFATRVTNTEGLKGFSKLKKVSFYMSAVDSLDFLTTTPAVEELNLYGFKHTFKDYQSLLSLPNLKQLNIYMNKQATDELLAPLTQLTSLEVVSMSNCKQVTSLSFLKNCKGIEAIKAKWCDKIADISVLANMPNLTSLDIEDSVVEDFSALSGKAKLQTLVLTGTAFSNISLLDECTDLMYLSIDETTIKDISDLSRFEKLRRVSVPGTIDDSQIDALKNALPNINIKRKK